MLTAVDSRRYGQFCRGWESAPANDHRESNRIQCHCGRTRYRSGHPLLLVRITGQWLQRQTGQERVVVVVFVVVVAFVVGVIFVVAVVITAAVYIPFIPVAFRWCMTAVNCALSPEDTLPVPCRRAPNGSSSSIPPANSSLPSGASDAHHSPSW